MANPFLNSLVKAQIAGATTGQLTGPSVASGQVASSANAAATASSGGGINGLLGGGILPNSPVTGFVMPSMIQPGATAGALRHLATIPNVGGVLFNRCADVLTEIGEIVGAYWDEANGSLVLMGKGNDSMEANSFALPAMDRDHLGVALRAAIAGDPIGVSIDPPAKYKSRPQAVPDGADLLVSYLGGTEGTLTGAILFEADRLLKCLCQGTDNETGKPLRAHVPGYRSLIESVHPHDGHAGSWHRFWFVIDKVVICRDSISGAFTFKDVDLRVLSEVELGGDNSVVDPHDQDFTAHLTNHYDQYAKEFPVLSRLKELAKIAAIAKYLVSRNVSMDLEALFATPPCAVATPKTTRARMVVSPIVAVTQTGNTISRQMVSICGGVDLDPPAPIIQDDLAGQTNRLQASAHSARPSPLTAQWEFPSDVGTLQAQAISIGGGNRTAPRSVDDYNPHAPPMALPVRRMYDVSMPDPDFGPGWRFWLPVSLTIRQVLVKTAAVLDEHGKKQGSRPPVLVLHDHQAGESAVYRALNSNGPSSLPRFGRLIKAKSAPAPADQTANKKSAFYYDPNDIIAKTSSGYAWESNGRRIHFDDTGRLTEYRAPGPSKTVVYTYSNGSLASLRSENGDVIEIQRESSNRISQILVPGHQLQYFYNEEGLLRMVKNNGACRQTFHYDAENRLIQIRGPAGAVSSCGVYDDLGRWVLDGSMATPVEGRKVIRRTVKNGRVIAATDDAGSRATFSYSPAGSLQTLTINAPSQREWKLEYDLLGRMVSAKNSLNQPDAFFRYDNAAGRLMEWRCGAELMQFDWNANGQLIRVRKNGKLVRDPRTGSGNSGAASSQMFLGESSKFSAQRAKLILRRATETLREWDPFRRNQTILGPDKADGQSSARTPCGTLQYQSDHDALSVAVSFRPK